MIFPFNYKEEIILFKSLSDFKLLLIIIIEASYLRSKDKRMQHGLEHTFKVLNKGH